MAGGLLLSLRHRSTGILTTGVVAWEGVPGEGTPVTCTSLCSGRSRCNRDLASTSVSTRSHRTEDKVRGEVGPSHRGLVPK